MTINPYYTKENNPAMFTRTAVKYQSIKVEDLKIRQKKTNFDALFGIAEILPPNAFIAGGSILSIFADTPINDIDIYFSNGETFEEVHKIIMDTGRYTEKTVGWATNLIPKDTDAALPIQLLRIAWMDDVRHAIDTFDYTVCQFGLHGDTIWCNPLSLVDLLNKEIRIHRLLPNHAKPLERLSKYVKKGYTAAPETYDAIEAYIQAQGPRPRRNRQNNNSYPVAPPPGITSDTINRRLEAVGPILAQIMTSSAQPLWRVQDASLQAPNTLVHRVVVTGTDGTAREVDVPAFSVTPYGNTDIF